MTTPLQIEQMRQRHRRARRKAAGLGDQPALNLGLTIAGLFGLLLAVGPILLAFSYSRMTRDLPPIEQLAALLESPDGLLLQPTRLYDHTGQVLLLTLENPDAPGRRYLSLPEPYPGMPPTAVPAGPAAPSIPINPVPSRDALPDTLISATLAVSDPNFWNHAGFSLRSLAPESHPTLAQRLVSDLLLANEPPSLQRALRERLLAAQATQHFGRPKILEWYLNSANYGRLAYGADAAARAYFNKSAADLDLAEAAVLAGVAEDPNLNPIDAPQAALERQKYVLQDMLRRKMANPRVIAEAASKKLDFRSVARPGQALELEDLSPNIAPAFARLALEQAATRVPFDRLARGGLRIITTLDADLQAQATCTASQQISRLTNRASDLSCEAARLLPAISGIEDLSATITKTDPIAEVVILDPVTGQVLALLARSSRDQISLSTDKADVSTPGMETNTALSIDSSRNHQGTRALTPHPAGTLISPWVYLTAFTRGFSPATLVWDLPPEDGTPLAIPNLEGRFRGPLRLRNALASDLLQPANTVLNQVGPENVWRTLSQAGIDQPQNAARPSSIIDVVRPLNLLEVAQTYAVLANRGVQAGHILEPQEGPQAVFQGSPVRPVTIESSVNSEIISGNRPSASAIEPAAILAIEDIAGQQWLDWSAAQTRPILNSQLAYLINHVLSDEAARWSSLGHPNPTETGHSAAVKLGRTDAGEDHWTIGYTPQRVIGVWLGSGATSLPGETPALPQNPNHESGQPTTPAKVLQATLLRNASASLWYALMQYSAAAEPTQKWDQPEGISTVQVCDPSGMLPTDECPNIVEEIFLAGSEPIQVDRMYRNIAINRESQRLATVYTPTDLIEERPYFIVPVEASEWARNVGFAVPPETYDSIPLKPQSWQEASITSPGIFAVVRGEVSIEGTAQASVVIPNQTAATPAASATPVGFESYRVQVGQGLNPQKWLLIGEDQNASQTNGRLGVWDTTGLDGLYAVQLVVVQTDQSVRRATTLVTVDNQPPVIEILSPQLGEEISSGQRQSMVLLAEIRDNLEGLTVEFWLNGVRLAQFIQPPYAISWSIQAGNQTFEVRAIDQAGNTSTQNMEFSVR